MVPPDDVPRGGARLTVDRPKIAWRPVHGVLLIDKPSGITSTAALARARRVFRAEKGGHTGTLDPLASGLLPLCFGEATKFASDLLDADKSYRATLRLGVATDSGDSDGHVVDTRPVHVDREAIDRVVARFRGPIAQVPPMHSALKKDGQPLYKLARQGITVDRAARNVVIRRLDVMAFDGASLTIEVDCSKGTYIRTLAVEIGELLGCGAHLTALRRTGVADLVVADAVPLAVLETMGAGDTRPASAADRPTDRRAAADRSRRRPRAALRRRPASRVVDEPDDARACLSDVSSRRRGCRGGRRHDAARYRHARPRRRAGTGETGCEPGGETLRRRLKALLDCAVR